VSFSV